MEYVLGIDLGTASSCAAVARMGRTEVVPLEERSITAPAAAYLDLEGGLVFGEQATAAGASDPRRLIRDFKRHIGANEPILVGETSVRADVVLGGFLAWITSRVVSHEGAPPDHIAIAHPAWWQDRQMTTLRLAIERADLDQVSLVPEPMAIAAATLGDQVPPDALVGVYDLGAGTFDASLLRRDRDGFSLVGRPYGGDQLGRIDLDQVLIFHVQTLLSAHWPTGRRGPSHAAAMARLRADCARAKETLTTRKTATIPVDMPGLDESIEVSRAELAQMVAPAVEHTVTLFSKMLADAGVGEDDLTALVLTGGATRIPAVARGARSLAGRDTVVVRADADYAVCRGAAIGVPAPAHHVDAGWGPVESDTVPRAANGGGADAPDAGEPTIVDGPDGGDGSRWRIVAAFGALVVVVALTVGLVWRQLGDGEDTTVGLASALGEGGGAGGPGEPGPLTIPDPPTRTAAAAGMVAISSGTYPLGAEDAAGVALDPTEVQLATYHVDVTEVTNEAYARFVRLHGAPAPVGWEADGYPEGRDDHPVVGVDPEWAAAYCTALGKRLPTEAEWEAAARGRSEQAAPWDDATSSPLPDAGTFPVGSIDATRGPTGTFDMVGNAWEWVAGAAGTDESALVRRGGATAPVELGWLTRQEIEDPTDLAVRATTGFRCAATVVDASARPDVFVTDITSPVADPDEAGARVMPSGVELLDDDFSEATGAWPEQSSEAITTEYTQPSGYRVSVHGATHHVIVRDLGGDDLSVATSVRLLQHDGAPVRFGLAFRAHPHPSDGGPTSVDENYYTFSVDPVSGTWDLAHVDALPYRSLRDQCTDAADDSVLTSDVPVLTATMIGRQLDLAIDGAPVCRFTMSESHRTGSVGLYVGTPTDTDAVVEFDWVEAVSR